MIVGVVEGFTVLAMTVTILPLLLTRVQRIKFCLHAVDECANKGVALVEKRARSTIDPTLEAQLLGLRTDLGHAITDAFKGNKDLAELNKQMGWFALVLGYGEADAIRPPPADAISQIWAHHGRVRRGILRAADRHPTWIMLRHAPSNAH